MWLVGGRPQKHIMWWMMKDAQTNGLLIVNLEIYWHTLSIVSPSLNIPFSWVSCVMSLAHQYFLSFLHPAVLCHISLRICYFHICFCLSVHIFRLWSECGAACVSLRMTISLMPVRKTAKLQMGCACSARLLNHNSPSQSLLIHVVCTKHKGKQEKKTALMWHNSIW